MAIDQVTDLQALRAISFPEAAESTFTGVRFVEGHTVAGDPGAGIFEWVSDPGGSPADNDGTVIKPDYYETDPPDQDEYDGPGRWIRQVDVRGAVHPEWWGVTGDGTTADYNRLKKCFESIRISAVYPKKPKVVFLAKIYLIKGELHGGPGDDRYVRVIELQEGEVVEGLGIDKTVLASRTEDGSYSTFKIAVIDAGRGPYPSADPAHEENHVVVRDLTIDCGFNQSSKHRTRQAIRFYGQEQTVERVKVINYGVGCDTSVPAGERPGECFPIFLATQIDRGLVGTIRECEVTEPGLHSSEPAYGLAEITPLTLGGACPSTGPLILGLGGRIVGNRVHDMPCYTLESEPCQPSSIHAITVANCAGTEITDNEVINCDGSAVYVVSWTDTDVIIRNNRLINVIIGVNIGVKKNEIEDGLLPSHARTRIENNVIHLGRVAKSIVGLELLGINLSTSDLSGLSGPDLTTIRLKDVIIARNFVRGSAITEGQVTVDPIGVRLWLQGFIFENLQVANNTLELPDAPEVGSSNFGIPYENALYFNPSWLYMGIDDARRAIRVHNNRNLAGKDLRLKLAYSQTWWPLQRGWAPYSTRLQCFRSPIADRAARVQYDDFLGQLPRSVLGWVDLSDHGGGVAGTSGEDGRPGIAELSTGPASDGLAMLMCQANSITLGGGLNHVVEFSVSRVTDADAEWRAGFMQSSGEVGAYFKFGNVSTSRKLKFICHDASGGKEYDLADWGDSQGDWFRYRIEVAADASEIRLFRSGTPTHPDAAEPIFLETCTLNIPTGLNLGFAFRIEQDPDDEQFNRLLRVDYFQHQVY